MADPISLVASLVTLLTTGVKMSRSIHQSIDSVQNCPKHIKAISSDLKGLYQVLGILYGAMSSDDTRAGILHPAVSSSLGETLTNTTKIFMELQAVVNSFTEASKQEEITKWAVVKYTWKAKEVEQWSRQLADHKLTLNIAIATANLINTGNVGAHTAHVAEEIRELKDSLTELLLGMEHMKNRYIEQNMVLSNYRSTIKCLARDTASFSSVPPLENHHSDAMAISELMSTKASTVFYSIRTSSSVRGPLPRDNDSTFIIAPSIRSRDTRYSASLTVSYVTCVETYDGTEHLKTCGGQLNNALQDHKCTITTASSTKKQHVSMVDSLGSDEDHAVGKLQIFVKGLSSRTEALQVDAQTSYLELLSRLHDRVGIPPERITLTYNGRRLTDPIVVPNNVTLLASVNAYSFISTDGVDDETSDVPQDCTFPRRKLVKRSFLQESGLSQPRNLKEWKAMYGEMFRRIPRSLTSINTGSSTVIYRREVSTQKRYAGYLKSLLHWQPIKRDLAATSL